MQIICKVKKSSVSISSKLNVALVEAACFKSRPPGATISASPGTLDLAPPSLPQGGLSKYDFAISWATSHFLVRLQLRLGPEIVLWLRMILKS